MTFDDSPYLVEVAKLEKQNADLVAALVALGAKPDGYCFCINQEQIEAGHTGECKDARQALAKCNCRKGLRDG